jgi:2-polyprenyl-3-methyl-5-hydroxy-6-metoxy-1,4-benzoquinol methylase
MEANDINTSTHYWDELAEEYQATEVISCTDYHHGPLLPGDTKLGILPPIIKGMRCLEVGSGAAQNSIYLATRGAHCTATDLSAEQLAHAVALAESEGCALKTVTCPMEQLADHTAGPFDLVHSSGALCFSANPAASLQQMGNLVAPDGTLVLSTIHPLAFAEWLEVDDDGFGVFLQSYFTPPAESAGEDAPGIAAQTWPISTIVRWIRDAGLRDIELWEPPAATTTAQMPYQSEIWMEHQERYQRVPLMLIIRARHAPQPTS